MKNIRKNLLLLVSTALLPTMTMASRLEPTDVSRVLEATQIQYEFDYGIGGQNQFEKINRRVFVEVRTEDNEDRDFLHPPAMVYLTNDHYVLASYYLEYDEDAQAYLSQHCHCCHLHVDDGSFEVHCEEVCTHIPRVADLTPYQGFEEKDLSNPNKRIFVYDGFYLKDLVEEGSIVLPEKQGLHEHEHH